MLHTNTNSMLQTNTTATPKIRTPTTRTMFDAVTCHLWIGVIRVSAVYFKCSLFRTSNTLMLLDLNIEHTALANGTHVYSCCVCYIVASPLTVLSPKKTPCNMMQQPPRLQLSPPIGLPASHLQWMLPSDDLLQNPGQRCSFKVTTLWLEVV